jgi:hypothetical protein
LRGPRKQLPVTTSIPAPRVRQWRVEQMQPAG